MRTVSAPALTILQTKLGTEPSLIIEVQWVANGQRISYGDKEILSASVKGANLETTDLDNVINVNNGGQSQQISITLDDTDGSIKAILDANDIHKRPCWVYQWFEGLPVADKFLIFKGQISSPLEWNEGDRTVRFDVMNRIEDAEVGFSIEEGNFPGFAEELTGKPWPLAFGTTINVPALKIRSPRRGVLKNGFGIRDFTLEPRLNQLKRTCCPMVFTGWRIVEDTNVGWGGASLRIIPDYAADADCECDKKAQILDLEQQIAAQTPHEHSVVGVVDGHKFPQGILITLVINGAEIVGRFNGDTFTIVSRRHPEFNTLAVPPPKTFLCPVEDPNADNNVENQNVPVCNLSTGQLSQDKGTNPVKSWAYYETFPASTFFWAEPGAEVYMKGDEQIIYVANLLDSDVFRVAAYRNFTSSGIRQLTTVPVQYYTPRISDFQSYQVTEIVMDRALSLRGEGWEDDIYVTMESSVGPNIVDIIEWFLTKYTTYARDTTSFNAVRTKVANYPAHFALLERRSIIRLLEEIAFQSRIAIYQKDDVFFLKYLSEEPTVDDTLTVSDILANTFALTHTPTEDLVTKFIAEWQRDYALDDPNKVILRHNVNRYGTHERVFDFFIYAHQELVVKSATFWLIRMANTWRRIRCETPISKLRFEVFDCAQVTSPHLSDGPVKCIIEQAQYNSANNSIAFELWTPIRSGERTPYNFAFPAQINPEFVYPDASAIQFSGGNAPNVQVTPPTGHVLGQAPQGFQGVTLGNSNPCYGPAGTFLGVGSDCFGDRGDRKPSDINDQAPGVNTFGSDATIPPSKNPVAGETELQRRMREARLKQSTQSVTNREAAEKALNAASGGTGGGANPSPTDDGQGAGEQASSDPQKLQDWLNALPEQPPDECFASVTVSWCPNVQSVSGNTVAVCSGGCPPGTGCNEIIYTNSDAAAQAIFQRIKKKIDTGTPSVGAPWPTAVGISNTVDPGCPEPSGQAIRAYSRATSLGGNGSASQGFLGGPQL